MLSEPVQLLSQGGDFASRRNFPMHVTAGALLVRGDAGILLVEHRAYGITLQPGGHLEPADTTLWLILNEAVIRRAVGGADVMHGQLAHLLHTSEWPNVTLQVLPLSSGAHPGLNGPFCILEFPERTDPDVVYTEGVAGHAYLERDSDVRACAEAFEQLRAAALPPAESAELIREIAREITH